MKGRDSKPSCITPAPSTFADTPAGRQNRKTRSCKERTQYRNRQRKIQRRDPDNGRPKKQSLQRIKDTGSSFTRKDPPLVEKSQEPGGIG